MKMNQLNRQVRPRALIAWCAMVALTLLSVCASGQTHHGLRRMCLTFVVASIAWTKGWLLIRHYLESHLAGPVFDFIIRLFALVAPMAMVVSALRESGLF